MVVEYKLGAQGEVPVGDKAILISGCDTGFGNMLATRMAKKGYRVFAGCLFPDKENAIELGKRSERIHIIGMDVTSDKSMEQARKEVEEKLGDKRELWAVVANAGVGFFSPLEWFPMKDIELLFDINILGVIRTVKTFLPFVRKAKGRVIATSSMAASCVNPHLIPYSMSKIAVKSMMQGLYRELNRFGVYCISIEPFFYRTPILTNMDNEQHTRRYNLLNDEDKKAYAPMMEKLKDDLALVNSVALGDLEQPIAAFEHALTSVRPKNSYLVGELLTKAGVTLSSHFASEYIDTITELAGNEKVSSALKKIFG